MKDIICEKCGQDAREHYWGGVIGGTCDQNKHEVYRAHIAKLEAENEVMYAAILEASTLGPYAALRCKVELQRIAKNEA